MIDWSEVYWRFRAQRLTYLVDLRSVVYYRLQVVFGCDSYRRFGQTFTKSYKIGQQEAGQEGRGRCECYLAFHGPSRVSQQNISAIGPSILIYPCSRSSLNRLQNPNHTHTNMGRALHVGIAASRINDKFQEPLYLALELSRAGVLHGNFWSDKEYSGGPSFGTREL